LVRESYTDEIDLVRKVDKALRIGLKLGVVARNYGLSYLDLVSILEKHSVRIERIHRLVLPENFGQNA